MFIEVLVGLFLGLGLSFFLINLLRTPPQFPNELRPNQLMTTHPVVFISGKRSLFYFFNYWNGIPQRLKDHGYEIEYWPLSWRSSKKRFQSITENLEQKRSEGLKCHILGDLSCFEELESLSYFNSSSVQSLHLITQRDLPASAKNLRLQPSYLALHRESPALPFDRPSPWIKLLTKAHEWSCTPAGFEPEILGQSKSPQVVEDFYLDLMNEIAVQDLKS